MGGYPQPAPSPPGNTSYGFQPNMPPTQLRPDYAPGFIESQDFEAKGFGFTDESIRKGFIKKVYSILCVSICF